MSEFKINLASGDDVYIVAKSRKMAIEAYCCKTGMSKDWFNAHCTIKRLGRVVI